MEEIADDQALDGFEFREEGAVSTPVSCMARTARGAWGSERIAFSAGHSGARRGEGLAQVAQARRDLLLGFEGGPDAVPPHEFEQAQDQLWFGVHELGSAEMGALAVHAEFGVGEARAPVAELGEQPAGLRFEAVE